MLSSDGNKMVIKSIGLISKQKKKNFARTTHFFFLHFFDVVLHDYYVKLPSQTSYVGSVLCAHQKFCCSCSRLPIFAFFFFFFFHCHSFLPTLSWLLGFLISYHQFSCFSSNKICLRCFLSNMLALSLLSTSLKTFKIQLDLTFLLFFHSKKSGGPCDFPP